MAHVDRTALAATTLNRKWYLDVDTNVPSSPTWTAVNGIMEFKGAKEATTQDDSDWDGSGWKSSVVTALSWSLEFKVKRAPTSAVATAYDTGQEKLRAYSDLKGTSNMAYVRWYEVTASGPIAEAYSGYASVSWSPDGGGMDALDTVTVTLTGIGARTAITHPDAAAVVPTTTSVTPSTGSTAGGELVKIVGTGFFADGEDDVVETTGVQFGSDNSTDWFTDTDNIIWAITPAHAAGAVDVKVTNATGASTVMCKYTYA
jgi:hypothetical protein